MTNMLSKAFEINAVDYLLKPFDPQLFQTAFNRAKAQVRQLSNDSINRRLQNLLETLHPSIEVLEKVGSKIRRSHIFLAG